MGAVEGSSPVASASLNRSPKLASFCGWAPLWASPPTEPVADYRVRLFSLNTELPFAGHPTVGASWWLQSLGTPVNTLQVPAGIGLYRLA
ncbi:MAG: hypothetical protein DI592_12570, partial [Stenotrophomonas maltophilia]